MQLERVYIHRLTSYNTTNYPRDKEHPNIRPTDRAEALALDYVTEHQKTAVSEYLNVYPVIWTWEFTPTEAKVLQEYAEIGKTTGRIPHSPNPDYKHHEDLNAIARRMQSERGERLLTEKWFFRWASVSPKDGAPPGYPITGPNGVKNILRMIVTSKRSYNALLQGDRILYFTKYRDDWNPDREFRVFIRKGRVTAISQYGSMHSYWSSYSDDILLELGQSIVDFCQTILKQVPKFDGKDLTMDVIVDPSLTKIELIEMNSFGYWQAAGSALFDWLDDYDKLYGYTSVCLRVANHDDRLVDAYTRALNWE